MSEYQSYEFQALDRPLRPDEQSYIHSLSSRVELNATRARFLYHYGDFRGNPEQVLDRCFDIMVYVASFGVRQLMIRLPKTLVKPEALLPYSLKDCIAVKTTPRSLILNIQLVKDDYCQWMEDRSYLDDLVSLREDMLKGDLRVLYLAWLAAGDSQDVPAGPEELIEPPVPANLQHLSPALTAFADLFQVDDGLIAAAAELSPVKRAPVEPIAEWVAALPEADRLAYLVRAAKGDTHVGMELMQRLRQEFGQGQVLPSTEPGRTLAELIAIAEAQNDIRAQQVQEAALQATQKRLTDLVPKADALWTEVIRLIDRKLPKAYDEAVSHLLDLREVATSQGTLPHFQRRLQDIQERYSGRTGLRSRLRNAGLIR